MPLLRSRSCCSRLFLSLTFCLALWSSRRVCKNAVIIAVNRGSGWESLVGVNKSVSSISRIGCSFFGTPRAFVLLSFSSFSSALANPSLRVHDWDRRELSCLSCSCICCCCLWRGVTCVAGITVVDPEDSEWWGLHSGVLLSSMTLVDLLK